IVGVSYVPANGFQTPLSEAICVPSAAKVSCGFGRRYAVICWAFDSSMLTLSASNVGLLVSKRARTSSQVNAFCALALLANPAANRAARHARRIICCINLPHLSLSFCKSGRLQNLLPSSLPGKFPICYTRGAPIRTTPGASLGGYDDWIRERCTAFKRAVARDLHSGRPIPRELSAAAPVDV